MTNVYNSETPRKNENLHTKRGLKPVLPRHYIYHFANTRHPSIVYSMSPNLFYKNRILKNGTPNQKRRRLVNLVGGDPNRAFTILQRTVENRNTLWRMDPAHAGQLEFYKKLRNIMKNIPVKPKFISRKGLGNSQPNANLVRHLKNYYSNVTENRQYGGIDRRIDAIYTLIRQIRERERALFQ